MSVFNLIFNLIILFVMSVFILLIITLANELYKDIIIKRYLRKFNLGRVMLKVTKMTDTYLFGDIDKFEEYIIDMTALIIDNIVQSDPILSHRRTFNLYNLKIKISTILRSRRYDRYFNKIEDYYRENYDPSEFAEVMDEFIDPETYEFYKDDDYSDEDDGYEYAYEKDGIKKFKRDEEEYPEDIAAELADDDVDEPINAEKEYGSLASAIHSASEL